MSTATPQETPVDQSPVAAQIESTADVLLDMRPALDGFYGIPQEIRLLFGALAGLPVLRVSGVLQMSTRQVKGDLAPGLDLMICHNGHPKPRFIPSMKNTGYVCFFQS